MSKLNQKGFTLIEVLISVVVLSVGVIGLASMVNQVIRNDSKSKNITAGTTFNQRSLELLRSLDFRSEKLFDVNGTNIPIFSDPLNHDNSDFTFTFNLKGKQIVNGGRRFTDSNDSNSLPETTDSPDVFYTMYTKIANEDNYPNDSAGLKRINIVTAWGWSGISQGETVLSSFRASYKNMD